MQTNDNIDWNDQWAKHAHGFKDGLAHIRFKDLGLPSEGEIVLAPGPGFGDFSHSTTRLVLLMMSPHVTGKTVLDVGCGSGILSLAAAHFGAKAVSGIDIDPDAVTHAKKNAELNHFSDVCHFSTRAQGSADILLMNMIRSEQKQAYMSLPEASRQFIKAFTSGILKEERATYLKQTAEWGWTCLQEKQKNGWLGFYFERQK